MKTESRLFAGVAAFFAATAIGYGWFSAEPAGTVALALACLMASLVSFFLRVQHQKRGPRAQDRGDAEVADAVGPLEFFPPHSPWPITVALGAIVLANGIVFGLWLVLMGFGLLAFAVCGLVFQYARRGAQRSGPAAGTSSGAASPGAAAGSADSPTSTRSP
ncbi:aa3-type cytochrome oxidase subunit IV [Streptomyces tagetis]|uniref:cytochrome-c oxidase n=1 Tax=Streptomyces tagetis TaxID=2820809 RepID=A0A941AY19_9ACTN|nr:cytochrome c oxidase subunit 4 [Streptomyces sp. RG38]MBQ0826884.1 cytochrome c oxidase subunit 4 [Streptomyces sp. RG38]